MPYTKEQRALFNAAANDPQIAERHGMSHKEARRLANEANRLKGEGREKKSAAKRIETEPASAAKRIETEPASAVKQTAKSFIDLSPVFGNQSRPR